MKKVSLLLIFSMIVFSNTHAQEINKKQWTLFSKTTADWCPNCGTWGWNMNKQLIEKVGDKNSIIWGLHVSGDLTNQTAKDLAANLGVNYHPIFFEGQSNMNVSSGNIPQKLDEAESIVDLNAILDPFAGIGVTATIDDDNTLEVKAEVEFLSNVEMGNYYLGLYLVEDNVVHFQQSIGSNAVHRYILRRSLLSSTFGDNLTSGEVASGAKFNVETTIPNIGGNKTNLKVVAIIWNKSTEGKYRFFNGNQVNVAITSGTNDQDVPFDIFANFQQDNLSIHFKNEDIVPTIDLTIIDIQGKDIFSTQISNEASWEKSIYLPIPTGQYFLKFDAKKHGSTTLKLFKP
ncbi:MAG: Omp28-related outer membrane protein [Saprospiraceae bacterium]